MTRSLILDFLRFEILLAGEGKQLAREIRTFARRIESLIGAFDRLFITFQLALKQLEIAHDDGEQIVEVMRKAAGQLSNGLHLLRLVQALRCKLALRDIDDLDDKLLDFGFLALDHGNAG